MHVDAFECLDEAGEGDLVAALGGEEVIGLEHALKVAFLEEALFVLHGAQDGNQTLFDLIGTSLDEPGDCLLHERDITLRISWTLLSARYWSTCSTCFSCSEESEGCSASMVRERPDMEVIQNDEWVIYTEVLL